MLVGGSSVPTLQRGHAQTAWVAGTVVGGVGDHMK